MPEQNSAWWRMPIFMMLGIVILVLLITWQAVTIINKVKEGRYIGRPTDIRDTISITGEGKVTGVPDVATVNVGMQTERRTVAAAQQLNTEKFNRLLADLKGLGIKEEDIQTSDYRINPVYDYTPERGSEIRGYEVFQSVRVKIRDLDKVGQVLTAAGQEGANQVSGLTFAVDDIEALRQQAREKALANAQAKADALGRQARVRLGKLVSYSESTGDLFPPYPAYGLREAVGGELATPAIEPGTLEVIINVTVSYEIF